LRSTANELRAAYEAQRADKRRIIELEKKSDRLAVQLSDREERLDRREKDLDRLKELVKTVSAERSDLERRLSTAERQRAHFESQNNSLEQRVTKLASVTPLLTADKTVKALESERDRLLETVKRLTREKTSIESSSATSTAIALPQPPNNDLLRDKIHELTARVVKMTVDGEGEGSPIPALLGKAEKKPMAMGGLTQDLPVSLADRIRALEHAARRG
jgi:chromosome segregation ATPase